MMRSPCSVAWIAAIVAGCGSTTGLPDGTADAAPDSSVADAAHVDAATDAGGGPVDASAADGSTTDARADAASFACGNQTCGGGEVCVRTYTTGGVCQLCGDGGTCPSGRHCGGQCCVEDVPSYAYACRATPSACAAGLASGNAATCHCLAP
jgi:hypothetical protein